MQQKGDRLSLVSCAMFFLYSFSFMYTAHVNSSITAKKSLHYNDIIKDMRWHI